MKGHTKRNSRSDIDKNGHNWSEFDSCFEQLFNMNDVSDENKREIFLALCGDVYDRLGNNGCLRRDENQTLESGHMHGHHMHRRHRGHHRHGPGNGHQPGHHPVHERIPHGQPRHHGQAHQEHVKQGKHASHVFCELHGRFRSFDRH